MTTPSHLSPAPGWDISKKPFPPAQRGDQVDTYKSAAQGEVKIADPYRWLETPPNQSPETKKWVESQADFAQSYIQQFDGRDELKKRLEASFSYARYSCPSLKYDGRFYYNFNSGLESQSRIFKADPKQIDEVEKRGSAADAGPPGEVFFDANKLSKDGTVALTVLSFSHSGKYLAYGVSKSGSDWYSVYFRSTDKPFAPTESAVEEADKGGKDRLADSLSGLKFSGVTWLHDDSGVLFQTYPPPAQAADLGSDTDANRDARLFYHAMGSKGGDEDRLILGVDKAHPNGMWGAEVTDDGRFLFISNSETTDPRTRHFVAALNEDGSMPKELKWLCVADKFDFNLGLLANDGNKFYLMTNKDAPRYRIVTMTFDPAKAKATTEPWTLPVDDSVKIEELIPEGPDGAVLGSATVLDNDKLLLVYSRNVIDELHLYDLTSGKHIERLLPNLVGSIGQISGKREDTTSFVSTSSFVSPGTIHRLEWDGGKREQAPRVKTHRETKVQGIDPNDYVSEQRWFTSVDGTKIPCFITHHKDTKLDGTAPAWLYAYGGFQIPLSPGFSPSMMTWVKSFGGVLVWVNARGGGEFGEAWHESGRRANKKHTFEDVLSGAKYLVDDKIAAKGKITINGGSNGGLTVMASLNMAKEEHGIGAGVAEVGVLDLLRFHRFTIGAAWRADYGDPDVPEDFDFIHPISPLHNIQPPGSGHAYPAMIFLTGDHDDRVSPLHTFKIVAELQHQLKESERPILARIDLGSGHGAGKSTQKRIEETRDKYAAVARALDLKMQG